MKTFAAHNPDLRVRLESSAGGIFSILAQNILQEGGVVYGVAFDKNWRIVHTRVDTIEHLQYLCGSKYAFSDIGTKMSDAIHDLELGRLVLFSGTPCQVAAMRQRVGENPNLLLVEVVCHGAPDQRYWVQYLSELCSRLGHTREEIVSINFRDKISGWKNYSFTIKFQDGSKFSQKHDDNLYMQAFLKDFLLRDACFHCPFKYPNGSKADITLGDLWGIDHLAPDINNDLGTTLIIARTSKGEKTLAFIEKDIEMSFNQVASFNPAIISSPQKPQKRKEFIEDIAKGKSILRVSKKYASQPISLKIYLFLAHFKRHIQSILNK